MARHTRLQGTARDPLAQVASVRSRNTHHANTRPAGGGGNGRNGVGHRSALTVLDHHCPFFAAKAASVCFITNHCWAMDSTLLTNQ